jgi:hypothetical protein
MQIRDANGSLKQSGLESVDFVYLPGKVNKNHRFVSMAYYLIIKILDIFHRLVFHLKHTMGNVRTSQETYYVSTTSATD